MYPAEPFSAAAFMNSPSSCFRVSAVACGGAEAAGRAKARTITPATSAATTTVRNNFMRPPLDSSAHSTPATLALWIVWNSISLSSSGVSVRATNGNVVEGHRTSQSAHELIGRFPARHQHRENSLASPSHCTLARGPSTPWTLGFAKHPLRSEFVTFSKLPNIDAANQAVTTTKSSKIQKSHKRSG